jgi:hypothetical protein
MEKWRDGEMERWRDGEMKMGKRERERGRTVVSVEGEAEVERQAAEGMLCACYVCDRERAECVLYALCCAEEPKCPGLSVLC